MPPFFRLPSALKFLSVSSRYELLLPLGNLGTIPVQGHVKLNSELEVFLTSVICAVKLCETHLFVVVNYQG